MADMCAINAEVPAGVAHAARVVDTADAVEVVDAVDAVDAVALDEAVEFTSGLIRIDTTNRGGGDCRERPAAEYVAERLAAAGLEPLLLERTPAAPTSSPGSRAPTAAPRPSSSTATSTWSRPRPPTGAWTPSPARSATGWSGGAAPST